MINTFSYGIFVGLEIAIDFDGRHGLFSFLVVRKHFFHSSLETIKTFHNQTVSSLSYGMAKTLKSTCQSKQASTYLSNNRFRP